MTNDEIWQLFRDNSYKDNYREYVGLDRAVTLGKRIRDRMLEINTKLSVENSCLLCGRGKVCMVWKRRSYRNTKGLE